MTRVEQRDCPSTCNSAPVIVLKQYNRDKGLRKITFPRDIVCHDLVRSLSFFVVVDNIVEKIFRSVK